MRCALDGYSQYAAPLVEADDCERIERPVRYVARPPLAQGRLEVRGESKVKWSLRRQ